MSFFDTLLQRHELTHPPQFLWMLKLRVEEYEELKSVLRNSPVYLGFRGLERECALYFAEWWRREYAGGHAKSKRYVKVYSIMTLSRMHSMPQP